jgi:hypothetical protein
VKQETSKSATAGENRRMTGDADDAMIYRVMGIQASVGRAERLGTN